MKVVITAATELEWVRIKQNIAPIYLSNNELLQVIFHTSGVGILASTFSITKLVAEHQPDLIIQIGIAGSFDTTIEKGSMVVVKDDYLGDTGVEEGGVFKDVFDLNLEKRNTFPFKEGALINPSLQDLNLLQLPDATGITVNEVTTQEKRMQQLKQKYNATIETMEGACLHYVCLQTRTPFIQVRAISNYIGERDKSKWSISTCLDNIQTTTIKYLKMLPGKQ